MGTAMRWTLAFTTVLIGGLALTGCEWAAFIGPTISGWSTDVLSAAAKLGAWRQKTPEVAGNTFRSSDDVKAIRVIINYETECVSSFPPCPKDMGHPPKLAF